MPRHVLQILSSPKRCSLHQRSILTAFVEKPTIKPHGGVSNDNMSDSTGEVSPNCLTTWLPLQGQVFSNLGGWLSPSRWDPGFWQFLSRRYKQTNRISIVAFRSVHCHSNENRWTNTPRRSKKEPGYNPLKRKAVFQISIVRFHVCSWGCKVSTTSGSFSWVTPFTATEIWCRGTA